MPTRIQRGRKRGWKKPAGAIVVSRGTPYGNPFVVTLEVPAGERIRGSQYTAVPTVEDAVECYRIWIAEPGNSGLVDLVKKNLRGKDLVCWCALCSMHKDGKQFDVNCPDCDQCHAEILLEISNA